MWDIAARTAHKDMDVREMVYAMKELNNISDSGALVTWYRFESTSK